MFYGSIVVIKRSGVDGSVFPVVNTQCLFGRSEGCDIRVQLATVSKDHCKININENDQVNILKDSIHVLLSGFRLG
jgi:antigen KI-67